MSMVHNLNSTRYRLLYVGLLPRSAPRNPPLLGACLPGERVGCRLKYVYSSHEHLSTGGPEIRGFHGSDYNRDGA